MCVCVCVCVCVCLPQGDTSSYFSRAFASLSLHPADVDGIQPSARQHFLDILCVPLSCLSLRMAFSKPKFPGFGAAQGPLCLDSEIQ